MTLGELKLAVANYLHRIDQNLTDNLDFFIEQARTRINRDLRVYDMLIRKQVTPTTNPWDLTTLLPGLIEIRSVETSSNGRTFALVNVGRETISLWSSGDARGAAPTYYSVDGNELQTAPGGENREYEVRYFVEEGKLINDTDTNATLNRLPSVWLYATLIEAFSYTQDTELMAEAQQKYNSEVYEANRQTKRRQAGASLQMSGASTWV